MKALFLSMLAVTAMLAVGCSTAPKTDTGREQLHNDAQASLKNFEAQDPGLQQVLSNSAGYAIFPSVGKGAAVVGGSYGHGEVYSNGERIGYCDLTSATVGASLGGQDQAELIVCKTTEAVNKLKSNNLTFDAQASAVAVKAGAATAADFTHGVAVFVMRPSGLMVDASIGGQKINFEALQ